MTATIALPAAARPQAASTFSLAPATRIMVGFAATAMSLACLYALARLAAGLAPDHPNLRDVAIMLHVASVLPAIPLGAWLLLARKGTPRHKQLGKVWVALMVATAISAVFIGGIGHISWIHIFVPLTLHGAWKTVATARAGNMAAHKSHVVGMYLAALMVPGIAAFALPGRLMNTLVFGG